ncbi:MAG: hypothetical protein LQ348_002756 [Seirophora lacunosa]|nr:MAG: hypothetical protein LQ348_002756 [Seirophora lacunosa]
MTKAGTTRRVLMANVATGPYYQESAEERLTELNHELTLLIEVFPHVLPEVLREVLVKFDGENRLEVAINSLLKHDDLWVKGRLRPMIERIANDLATTDTSRIPETEMFRSSSYRWAVKVNLLQEFKSLSKSTVKAVLAEKNHSYTMARPVLQGISSKTWRHSIGKFFSRWSKSTDDVSEKHGMIQWTKAPDGSRMPILRETGDAELDQELHDTVLAPLLARHRAQQEVNDQQLAEEVNLQEAISADGLFECGCCFGSTTFEQMACCTKSLHIICFDCISRAMNEALYGQSWGQTVDPDRGLLKCLVPTADESCSGCIPYEITQRAVIQSPKGLPSWLKFESRLREEALTKAQVPLVRCPVCSYAESTDLYLPPDAFDYTINYHNPLQTLLYIVFALLSLPLILTYLVLRHLPFFCNQFPSPSILLHNSLIRLTNRSLLPTRFRCRAPTCLAQTCMTCSQPWLDPHTCSNPCSSTGEPTSLRTAIDSARTAALKRTCPRCNTSFIKDSGCNKLTCVCGYSMCYVCRQGLGEREGGQGYRHFCQHFRVRGGKCGECESCDLYGGDDGEAEKVELAGRKAEKEWRERWSLVKNGGGVLTTASGEGKRDEAAEVSWSVQGEVDWWVSKLLACKERPPRRQTDGAGEE